MALKRWSLLAAAVAVLACAHGDARAQQCSLIGAVHAAQLDRVHLHGSIVDLTNNHGCDHRFWSRSLYEKRDMYIYLPPDFDQHREYPLMIFLHGFNSDERAFLRMAPIIDNAICQGKLPPMIVAAPDGSLCGQGTCQLPGSFWVNSNAGNYEDYVLQDVWDYVTNHYPICSDRSGHILFGVSMGGFGAFNLGIRHRNSFGVVVGVLPPLNLRWQDCTGNPRAEFDPRYWGWRQNFDNENDVVGRFGIVPIRMGSLIRPVFGSGDLALAAITANNPIELIDRTRLHNGDLEMFIAYAGHDEFNIEAQVESFLYMCKHRGIGLHAVCNTHGRHDAETAYTFVPSIIDWLAPRVGCSCGGCGSACSPAVVPSGAQPKVLP
jgi:S-formylglutathione hydrolase FrmB